MRTNLHRLAPLTALLAVASVTVSGCTVSKASGSDSVKSGSIQKIAALKGANLKVGSKDFDEQLVLGQVAMVALEAAGATPVDKTNIQGTNNTRLALTGGAVDLYREYTGTAWISFLKQTKPVVDSQKQFEAVAQADAANAVTWWDRAPANNTYALAQTQATLAKYGVKTLSDYAARQEGPGRGLDVSGERVPESGRRIPRCEEDLWVQSRRLIRAPAGHRRRLHRAGQGRDLQLR